MQDSTTNNSLFVGRSAPRFLEEATRSWWLDAQTREAFADAAEREQRRMQRSAMGRKIGMGITVGWGQAIGGRTK
jgi:hypothetical protein